ncbi:hypothetical protein BY458DRAFT_523253 [Sporodiniella umbellata]|nr:hypothetical protein BY458DRAFT_523253 [Sporodiniella umbellata]
MAHLNRTPPSMLALYSVSIWIVSGVMAQDDGLDNDNGDDGDESPTGVNLPNVTTADPGITTTTPADISTPTVNSNTAPTIATTPTSNTPEPTTDTFGSTASVANIPSSSINTFSSTMSTTPTLSSSSGSKSNAGGIAGGVVGALVGLAIVGAIAFWFLRKKRRNDREVFRPDSEADEYSNSSRLTNDQSAPMSEQNLPPRPPRHSYYDPNNQPIVY